MELYHPEDAVYWLWLQRKLGTVSRAMYSITDIEGGARRIHESSPEELWQTGRFSVKTINELNDRDLTMDGQTLARCADLGMSITHPGDRNYPEHLLNLPDPPAVIYYKGRLRELSRRLCIGVVGSRDASDYGRDAAFELSERLSRAGVTVVSGVAKGIDTCAHNGALNSEAGGTIAVLGCSLDYRYNVSNELLRERMAQRSAIMSEYPPGTAPLPYNLRARNRLISGLSRGVVVVEAGAKSGSLVTAGFAAEQNRNVYVIPTGVGCRNSAGVHRLLQEGASPVRSPIDILRDYYAMYPGSISLSGTERPLMYGREPEHTERMVFAEEPISPAEEAMKNIWEPDDAQPPDFLSEGAKKMYQYLRRTPLLADSLAEQASVTPEEAVALLSELELCGCAVSHPGGRYSLGDA